MTMKMYSVTFKVNGNRCQKTVMADSPTHAKSEVQSFYSEKLVFMGVREVR